MNSLARFFLSVSIFMLGGASAGFYIATLVPVQTLPYWLAGTGVLATVMLVPLVVLHRRYMREKEAAIAASEASIARRRAGAQSRAELERLVRRPWSEVEIVDLDQIDVDGNYIPTRKRTDNPG